MTSFARCVTITLALLLWGPGSVRAQGDECEVIRSGVMNIYNSGDQEMVFIGGGAAFRCPDGTTIESDSVARFTATGLIEFIGRVRYTDAENILTADYVRYLEAEQQAIAQGDVVLTDRSTGSVIQGPVMNYFQATETRPESLVRMASGRPHAVLVSVSRADSTAQDTTIVDADAMDIIGRERFEGRGDVEMQRADVLGVGDEAWYDRSTGALQLWRDARLVSEEYTLSGDTVRGITNDLDELQELTAVLNGRLDGRDVNVEAPLIRLFFKEGEVDRLVAVGEPVPEPDELGPEALEPVLDPTTQAAANSTDFRLTADSIDVLAPRQNLERVIAVGRAYGERLGDDLANANVPAVAARDWMRGDTVIATFVEAPMDPEATDTTASRMDVDRVIAVGVAARARSAYRVRDDEDPEATNGINYLLAQRITIHMVDGAVSNVEADGNVQGMYLEPSDLARVSGQGGEGRSP